MGKLIQNYYSNWLPASHLPKLSAWPENESHFEQGWNVDNYH